MADYYVDTSQTFNGDGTASTGAASDGAVGAANSFIEVATGNHAAITLTAGDNVIIRTAKTGVNCTESFAVISVTSAAGTISAPITYTFDDGTIWGESGIFELKATVDNNELIFSNNTIVNAGDSSDKRLELILDYVGALSYITMWVFNTGVYRGIHINAHDFAVGFYTTFNGSVTVHDLKYTASRDRIANNETGTLLRQGSGTALTIHNLEIDLPTAPTTLVNASILGTTSATGDIVEVNNVKVIGGYSGVYLLRMDASQDGLNSSSYRIRGVDLGVYGVKAMNESVYTGLMGIRHRSEFLDVNKDMSYYAYLGGYFCEFVYGGGQPALNALLPDSLNTKWSYKIRSVNTATPSQPLVLPNIDAYYSDTSGAKTISLNFLFDTINHSPTTENFYAIIDYTDSSGNAQTISTYSAVGAALTTSTATWTIDPPTFNLRGLSKFKIEESITLQQNSTIRISLFTHMANADTSLVFFIDPSVGIV